MLIGGRCPVVGENGDSVGTQIIEHATSFDDRGIDVGQRERREEAEPIRPPVTNRRASEPIMQLGMAFWDRRRC